MPDKFVSCPSCDSDNLNSALYCGQCGTPLRLGLTPRARQQPRPTWGITILLAILLSVVMTLALHTLLPHPPVPQSSELHSLAQPHIPAASLDPRVPAASIQPTRRPESRSSGKLAAAAPAASFLTTSVGRSQSQPDTTTGTAAKTALLTGTVAIIDPWGNQINSIPVAVVGGAWIALPARTCIGGTTWRFRSEATGDIDLDGGLWGNGDTVGFWRLRGDNRFVGPDFRAWQPHEPVVWQSLLSNERSGPMSLTAIGEAGIFTLATLEQPLGPGLFFQRDAVVGWSFGNQLDGAYLWSQAPGLDLIFENYVADFYRITFADSREDFFSRALALAPDASVLAQLRIFIAGFRLESQLPVADVPEHLRLSVIRPYVRQLVRYLMGQEAYAEIASLTDEPLLRELRDSELLMSVVRAITKSRGVAAALHFLDGDGAVIRGTIIGTTPYLDRLQLDLYLQRLRDLLDDNQVAQGWEVLSRARNRFGRSMELHLFGVELALADNDWAEAESRLLQQQYPPSLREKSMLLAARIAALKSLEGKIVIRFPPGSRTIPTTATINGALTHDFLIDTGASMVTIPSAVVEALGLTDEVSEQSHTVQTAGGTVNAGVVVLSSIELQGWMVSDVTAYVLDIPNNPDLGLLGLNFLDRFRMDLKADQGLLLLEPL